ncbi:SERINE/THREONINE-PROTEIN KINASE-RELATED [Salix purpurea]|uniref:SERINE/THREONINE-PROTEIN KINASE-RELATED n=1 Tax=Salix purpurea TaxID=77065 RepID=A0A9Q1AG94_SALPP|nr:SERINE/THREONINE-PROTEIN KINASE-RELATED [Salix purpurea]
MLRDGTMAAVKVLSAESRQGIKEFLTEIKVIADIEHNNLVKLYGYCAEGNHRILVYGYLENNSLAQTLLGGGGHSNIQFSWPTRRKICIGVARGLAFPANLTHISTNVAGTARSNTNRRLPPEEQYLVERAWEFYQKQELVNLVDTSLAGNYDVEEACNYLKIGLLCTQDVPKQRPSMSTAVLMLMGEIEVSDKISRPGMLSEFMSFKGDKMRKHGDEKDQNNKWETKDSGKGESSSSSLGLAETSNATMTFSSIYDRDN